MTEDAENSARIRQLFDSSHFRLHGQQLVDMLADWLEQSLQGKGKVLQWREPAAEDLRWQQALPQQPLLDAAGLLQRLTSDILPGSLAIHHPRNMGHQVATPLPMAALCDLVAALSNQAMAVYETGPSATMLERQVIRWLTTLIGWQQADGILTSGGAQANLTALLAARQRSAAWNVWQQGTSGGAPLRILASAHAHYSVARAAGIMGLGTDGVISIATDREGRMQIDALRAAHAQCRARGQQVMAVVANAGCTATGSIDPLQAIGRYCNAEQLWLHVDGAHGASALLSNMHRSQLRGIELADSVVWDGHKLLYMPATVSAVLFREADNSFAAFAQDASYLFQSGDHAAESFNVSYRTLECTKRMMGLKLWAAFSLYGVEGLGLLVDKVFATAALFARKLAAHAQFELHMQPQTNIVCFRHRQPGLTPDTRSRHQAAIRQKIVESGAFHFTQVRLDDEIWLRTALMNPLTEAADLDALLAAITQAAA